MSVMRDALIAWDLTMSSQIAMSSVRVAAEDRSERSTCGAERGRTVPEATGIARMREFKLGEAFVRTDWRAGLDALGTYFRSTLRVYTEDDDMLSEMCPENTFKHGRMTYNSRGRTSQQPTACSPS